MKTFPKGTQTVFARAISAEIRARIAADRSMTGQKLAQQIGLSQNYVAIRLRDEKPFTLDDLEKISTALETDPEELFDTSLRHYDMLDRDLREEWASVEAPNLALVATEGELEPGDLQD